MTDQNRVDVDFNGLGDGAGNQPASRRQLLRAGGGLLAASGLGSLWLPNQAKAQSVAQVEQQDLLPADGLPVAGIQDVTDGNEDGRLLQRLIDEGVARGDKDIVLPPGRYRTKPKNREHLLLANVSNVHIHAQGVELICTQTTRAITTVRCRNVTLSGLVIDHDPLPYTQGQIVGFSSDRRSHEIALFDGFPTGEWVVPFKYEIFKPDTRTLRFGSYNAVDVLEKAERRIVVQREPHDQGEQLGDVIAIGVEHAPDGQIPHAVFTTQCENMRYVDVSLHASNCFGFFETECKQTVYLRCIVDRRIRDDFVDRVQARIRSLNADAFHSKHAVVGPQLIGCVAQFQGDDCLNICGDYHMVMAADGKRLRVLSKERMNLEVGDPLEVVAYDGTRLPDAKVVSLQEAGQTTDEEQGFLSQQRLHQPFREGVLKQIWEVVIDRDYTQAAAGAGAGVVAGVGDADEANQGVFGRGAVIAAANKMGNGFLVKDGRFGHNRSRGLLIKASQGKLINNHLDDVVMEAIKIAPEYWWLESGSSSNIVVRNNTIENGDGEGIAVYAIAGKGGMAPAGAHRNIRIENNTIRNQQGRPIYVTSTDGLVLRNNAIEACPAEPPVVLEHCEQVKR